MNKDKKSLFDKAVPLIGIIIVIIPGIVSAIIGTLAGIPFGYIFGGLVGGPILLIILGIAFIHSGEAICEAVHANDYDTMTTTAIISAEILSILIVISQFPIWL